ncbi:MAG TPA: hypothetical protein EYN79_03010, partial [Planctomycetes bacterium]|nr:hypothetical protein [Planctomycetota bacterium]
PENFWAEYRRSGDSAPRDALLENYLPLVAAALARLGSLGTDRRLETIAIETLAGVISRRQRMGSSGFVTKASRGISRALSRAIGENAAFSKQVEKAKVRVDKVWDRLLADGDGEPEPENFLGSVSGNPREAQDLLLLARLSDGAVDVTASSKLLADMSAEEKCIIQMLYGEELTQKEVSAAIGIPEAMVVSIEGMILARLRRGSRDVDNSTGETATGVRTIAITSGKGGVGKTQVCVGLSIEWARQGNRVLIVDCDLGLANVELLFDINPKKTLQHHVGGGCSLDEVLVEIPPDYWRKKGGTPGGKLVLLPGASGVTDLADLDSNSQERMLSAFEELASTFDLMLFDTGAGIGSQVRRFCHFAGETVVVTNREPPSRGDAYSLIKALSHEDSGLRIWLMSNLTRGDTDGAEVHKMIAETAMRRFQQEILFAGSIPDDPQVARAVERKMSVTIFDPRSPAARAISAISHEILGSESPDDEDFFARLKRLF